ncbi:hypothetical protein ANN_23399 [Periplaneta americana]|uniref:Uncharacterized protein n=1 Tax=Periplaneta americana TaxID=6978 RepID=A0ABQ8SLF1_PERAM|nr:hypothetical protein ANN_23399 [Periplaneta americana]
MKLHCSHVVLCLAAISSVSLTARILALFNYNARSHFIMFEPLLRGLANRGHEVFVVGHFPQKTPIPNYTDINVQDSIPSVVNNFTVEYVRSFGLVNQLRFIWEKTLEMCETVMNHPEVQELIRNSDSHKFDLIITHIFGPDCFLGFSHIFNAPFISLVTSVALPWTNDRVGNPDNPSYIPNFFCLSRNE